MTIQLNGESRDVPDGLNLAALVEQLGMKPDRVAVELNLEIVPRANWESTQLKNGDKLEIVHFVGGGIECQRLAIRGPLGRRSMKLTPGTECQRLAIRKRIAGPSPGSLVLGERGE